MGNSNSTDNSKSYNYDEENDRRAWNEQTARYRANGFNVMENAGYKRRSEESKQEVRAENKFFDRKYEGEGLSRQGAVRYKDRNSSQGETSGNSHSMGWHTERKSAWDSSSGSSHTMGWHTDNKSGKPSY